MAGDPLVHEFKRRLAESHLTLQSSDESEDRFVFDLSIGTIVIDQHPFRARQLLLLAEAVYTKGHGLALELAGLVARRRDLDEACGQQNAVVWRSPDLVHARLNQTDWVRFEDWIADQFLLEDAIAKMLEGVPI